jgi:hypothetical protein
MGTITTCKGAIFLGGTDRPWSSLVRAIINAPN